MPVIEATDLGIVKINELYGQTVFGSGTPTASALTTFIARTATTTPIVVKGAASQTGGLQEWQNSSATILATISNIGNMRISGSLGYVGGGGSQLVFQSGNNPA